MIEITVVEENTDLYDDLPDELEQVTEQVLLYKNNIETSTFEIGKRLKYVKDILSGHYIKWLKDEVNIHPSTASRLIQLYEQFGDIAASHHLGSGKLFEMLALPENVDRKEFIEGEYIIPSSGERKTIEQMTTKEVREVTKPLKDAEKQKKLIDKEQASGDNINLPPNKHQEEELDNEPLIEAEKPFGEFVETKEYKNTDDDMISKFFEDVLGLVKKYDSLPLRLQVKNVMIGNNIKEFEDAIEMLRSFTTKIMTTVYNKPVWEDNLSSITNH